MNNNNDNKKNKQIKNDDNQTIKGLKDYMNNKKLKKS